MAYPITVSVVSAGSDWRVTKSGSHVSNHRKKKRAVKKGKKLAKDHDGPAELRIQAADGRWQDIRNYDS